MNKKTINVLVNKSVNNSTYLNFLSERYNVNPIDCLEYDGRQLDLVLFTGGEDVSPSYYRENKGIHTGINSSRDEREERYMFIADYVKNVPKLGICRGAQFLTVMSGGSLIQHVTGHAIGKLHPINIKAPYSMNIDITSTHHQMMYPFNMRKEEYDIIATSYNYLSNTYLDGNNSEKELPSNFEECEIVFYPNTKSLCIQGHPEMGNCPEQSKEICLDMINYYLKI